MISKFLVIETNFEIYFMLGEVLGTVTLVRGASSRWCRLYTAHVVHGVYNHLEDAPLFMGQFFSH